MRKYCHQLYMINKNGKSNQFTLRYLLELLVLFVLFHLQDDVFDTTAGRAGVSFCCGKYPYEKNQTKPREQSKRCIGQALLFVYFFVGLECVGHTFAHPPIHSF
jgi:hypothetical protein